jgi:small subunit ribosomal protein S15
MNLPPEEKKKIVLDFGANDGDTGSPEVQIALLTHKIKELTEHCKTHAKDFASRRGLLMMVAKRKNLLRYLLRKSPDRYANLTGRLGLRR